MVTTPRASPKLRNTPREWAVIIAASILIHVVLIFLFKPQYLEVFRSELPAVEEGDARYPFLDRPFRVISIATEPRVAPSRVEVTEEATDKASEFTQELTLGEPQTELVPLSGGGGGKRGVPPSSRGIVEPKPLFIPWPKYPRGLKEIPQGNVELRLLVNENGEVEEAQITRALPVTELNRIAAEAARKIRFTPGTEKGVRTSMWVRLAIGFQPR